MASEWWVSLLGCFPTNSVQAESSGKLRPKAKDIVVRIVEKAIENPEAGLYWSRRTYSILVNERLFPIAGDQELCPSVRAGCTHQLSL